MHASRLGIGPARTCCQLHSDPLIDHMSHGGAKFIIIVASSSSSSPSNLRQHCAGFQDILIPNTIEGDIYKRNDAPVDKQLRASQAGSSDGRRPAAIWRGTIVGKCLDQGLRGSVFMACRMLDMKLCTFCGG